MSTRTLISTTIAGLLAAVSALVLPDLDTSSWRDSFSPRLLEPTGSHAVGVRRMRVETGADDPWNPGHARVVMADVHYPAAAGEHPLHHYAKAQHMTELGMLAWAPGHEKRLGLREDQVHWLFRTHSHEWAPPHAGRYPVVVISAASGGMRTSFTMLAEDLASRGHVVVTVDHPYDAPVVELWPTRKVIEAGDAAHRLTGEEAGAARTADVTAVADRMPRIGHGISEALMPGCVVVVADGSRSALTGLTDEPLIEAQIARQFPHVKEALASDRSVIRAGRDFRTRSARFNLLLQARLAAEPACREAR